MKDRAFVVALSVASMLFASPPAPGGLSPRSQSEVVLQAFDEGKGSPIVMLGGGTFGATAFAPHAQMLANDFRVLRLQTLNIERAQKHQPLPTGYSVKMESAAMARALDQSGIRSRVDLVGWSFGALVALDFALDHPDRVRTLTVFEPPAFWAVSPDELRARDDMRTMYELSKGFLPTSEQRLPNTHLHALGRAPHQSANIASA